MRHGCDASLSQADLSELTIMQKFSMIMNRVLFSETGSRNGVPLMERTQIQVAMEVADAAELIGKKVRAKFEKVNFNFRVSKIE